MQISTLYITKNKKATYKRWLFLIIKFKSIRTQLEAFPPYVSTDNNAI